MTSSTNSGNSGNSWQQLPRAHDGPPTAPFNAASDIGFLDLFVNLN